MTENRQNGQMGETINVPAAESFDTEAMQGSMQQILSENIGNFVRCEFLIGTQLLQERTGILYAVGASFLVLHNVTASEYILCDIFSIKFVTFYDPGASRTPMPIPAAEAPSAQTGDEPALPALSSGFTAPGATRARSQAALNYVKRKSGI